MRRRLFLLALVPVVVGTTAGASLAVWRAPAPAEVTLDEPSKRPEPRPEPSAGPVVTDLDAAQRSGVERELPKKKKKKKKREERVDVAAVQERLTELRYYVGPIDGEEGPSTTSAVMAFQKVNGLSVDGVVGPQTLAALKDPVSPELRGGESTRAEVDLTTQVLYFVEGGELQRIVPVSSGSGASYETSDGGTARSLTPVGTFRVERNISGIREAPLGTLYDPMYFYYGWAIHGSNSVPAYPASHGCVRVTRDDALWLFDRLAIGTQVVLYGGTHTFVPGSGDAGTTEPAGDTGDEPEPEDDDDKSGDEASGDGKSGDGKSGDGKSGDGTSGDGKSGDEKSGDGKSGDGKADGAEPPRAPSEDPSEEPSDEPKRPRRGADEPEPEPSESEPSGDGSESTGEGEKPSGGEEPSKVPVPTETPTP